MANYRVLITVETMQANMSPLTDLDMHDQFAKPRSNSAVLLKKKHSSLEHSIPAYSTLLQQHETSLHEVIRTIMQTTLL